MLFAEKDGTRSSSQIMAFEDTWEWNVDTERAYEEIVERGGRVSEAMRPFRTLLGHSDMMAYLHDGSASDRTASGVEGNGVALSALRSDSEPRLKNPDGRRFRPK